MIFCIVLDYKNYKKKDVYHLPLVASGIFHRNSDSQSVSKFVKDQSNIKYTDFRVSMKRHISDKETIISDRNSE